MPMQFIRMFYCLKCNALSPLWHEKCQECGSDELVKVSIEASDIIDNKEMEARKCLTNG